jgi:tetratricopeptide (TPR) repeat protein
LRAEEANLHYALQLARTHHLHDSAMGCAQGLDQLYQLTGRTAEWARLVADIHGDFIDPATDKPRAGCEENYSIIMGYRVRIAQARRDWPTATRLQSMRSAWNRDRAAPYLDLPLWRLRSTERSRLHSLANSEHYLGQLLAEQHDPACREHLQAAYDLSERIGDDPLQAGAAGELGNAFLFVPGLRNLDEARRWFENALNLTPEHDRIRSALAHCGLASTAFERFSEAQDRGVSIEQLTADLEQARAGYQNALYLLHADHHGYRANIHNHLGRIHGAVRDVPRALDHYQQSLHHSEAVGDTYSAGQTRLNIALLLDNNGRADDALHYARAAVTNLQHVDPSAAEMAGEAAALVRKLER